MSKDFTVEIVFGASEGYTAEQTKTMAKPAHISGETVSVDISTDDFKHLRTFGPYLWVDAATYAQHADTKARFVEAIAAMVALDQRHDSARYPGNDWSGLLDTVKA